MADLSVKQTVSIGSHGQPWSLCLSPDERYIMVGCSDGKVVVRCSSQLPLLAACLCNHCTARDRSPPTRQCVPAC